MFLFSSSFITTCIYSSVLRQPSIRRNTAIWRILVRVYFVFRPGSLRPFPGTRFFPPLVTHIRPRSAKTRQATDTENRLVTCTTHIRNMAGKKGGGGGENSKKAAGNARKAEAAAQKAAAEDSRREAKEAAEWDKGAKNNSKK